MRLLRTCTLACVASLAAATPALAAPTFTQIAREFTGGLVWLNVDLRPALADNGQVLFAGSTDFATFEGETLFFGNGGPLTARDPAADALFNVRSPQINALGQIVVIADRDDGVTDFRGVFRTSTTAAGFLGVFETALDPATPSEPLMNNVALSENGTVAFATLVSASGAIYRGPVDGAVTSLRTGSGTFFNVRDLDVNNGGTVAVQMEYTDPTAGLSRGILLFDSVDQPLTDIDTAIERLNVGVQPLPAINASRQVAFALAFPVTLLYFDPPGVFSDPPAVTITLTPGVYRSTPTPWGEPNEFEQIANTTGPYASFGRVRINDSGLVVFEATLDAGGFGIFTGTDPVTDKVVALGDTQGDLLFSFLELGELNNAGQISLLASDFNSTDRFVFRVDNLCAEPPKPPHHKPPHHKVPWLKAPWHKAHPKGPFLSPQLSRGVFPLPLARGLPFLRWTPFLNK